MLYPQDGRFQKLGSLRNLAERRLEPIFDDRKPINIFGDGIAWFTFRVSHTKMYKNMQISLSLLRQGTSYRKTFSENIPKEWITRKKILRCCYSSIRKSGHIWKHVEWEKCCRLGEKVTTWCLWKLKTGSRYSNAKQNLICNNRL